MDNIITVAAAVITNSKNQLLLVRKKNTRFFMQVGGKLEPNEPSEKTIVREILEEVGAHAKIKQYIGCFTTQAANEQNHQLVSYLYQVELDQEPQIHAEIVEMKWIDMDDQSLPLAPLTTQVVIPWCREHFNL